MVYTFRVSKRCCRGVWTLDFAFLVFYCRLRVHVSLFSVFLFSFFNVYDLLDL